VLSIQDRETHRSFEVLLTPKESCQKIFISQQRRTVRMQRLSASKHRERTMLRGKYLQTVMELALFQRATKMKKRVLLPLSLVVMTMSTSAAKTNQAPSSK